MISEFLTYSGCGSSAVGGKNRSRTHGRHWHRLGGAPRELPASPPVRAAEARGRFPWESPRRKRHGGETFLLPGIFARSHDRRGPAREWSFRIQEGQPSGHRTAISMASAAQRSRSYLRLGAPGPAGPTFSAAGRGTRSAGCGGESWHVLPEWSRGGTGALPGPAAGCRYLAPGGSRSTPPYLENSSGSCAEHRPEPGWVCGVYRESGRGIGR